VLEIHRPSAVPGMLANELLHGWPSYLAYIVAFFYVSVVWFNHHYLFEQLAKVDLPLSWINFAVLGTIALIPFPTGVLAGAIRDGNLMDQQTAVLLYAIVSAVMSAAWIPLFAYVNSHPDLVKSDAPQESFSAQITRPVVGVVLYVIGGILGWFVHPAVAVAIFILAVGYYAVTSTGIRPPSSAKKSQ
jgi:uncharacterized membrane protein